MKYTGCFRFPASSWALFKSWVITLLFPTYCILAKEKGRIFMLQHPRLALSKMKPKIALRSFFRF